MTVVERDGPCVIYRIERGSYAFFCHDCMFARRPHLSRRDAEDLFDRHTHGEAE